MLKTPLLGSQFSLDASGVAGFFGGDKAVSAMATVHIYEGRRWLGWYNTPGSYNIARRYGKLACSAFWKWMSPGKDRDPATLFELDGKHGPKFAAAHSGTHLPHTGHIAHLLSEQCKDMETVQLASPRSATISVTIVDLWHTPDAEMYPARLKTYSPLLASIPIIASIGTCTVCALFHDWISFAAILLGMLSNGLCCFVIGSGRLTFTRPKPASAAPDGDGVLGDDGALVVLKGTESAVTAVTRGYFGLEFDGAPEFRSVGICSMLLMAQSFAQLLLIPQGALFGQIMFLASLTVSSGYHVLLSSFDKEDIQREILMEGILKNPLMWKYELGSRTQAVVFALLVLRPENLARQLPRLLPADTAVWRRFQRVVVKKIQSGGKLAFDSADWSVEDLCEQDLKLLQTLFADAEGAYQGYLQHLGSIAPTEKRVDVSKLDV